MWTQKQLYYNVILPYSQVLEDLEYYGMRIDEKELYKLKEEFEDRKRDLENDIYKDTGVINLRSSEQKAEAIFGRLGIPKFVIDYEKDFKSNWSETKDYLLTDGGMNEVRAGSNPENLDYKFFSLDIVNCQKLRETTGHPVFQKLIDLSEVNKLLSSYIYSLIKGDSKGRQLVFDNYAHPSYFPFTKGGRLVATVPAVLTISSRSTLGKKVKKIFIPDSDEYTLVRMDYSAIELRFLAWLAKERVMMKAFLEDVDLHALTTAHIPAFKLTYEEAKLEVNKLQRFYGKTTNFTLVYLGTYFSLQETFLKKGIYLNKKVCHEFEKSYFSLYPDIKPYWDRVKNSLISYGYVENLWGRRRYFPGLKDLAETKETRQIIHNALKSSVSHIVSGSSTGDYVPLKALESIELMKKKKYNGRFWCVIHDAFMYQIKKDQREEFTADMETCLQTPTPPVTIAHPVETRHNTSWYGL